MKGFGIVGVMGLVLIVPGAARAQTAPPSTNAPSNAPTTGTPPNGVARGVIRPNRPVDSGVVIKPPPTHGQTMPVIKPPGTAR